MAIKDWGKVDDKYYISKYDNDLELPDEYYGIEDEK